MFATQQIRYTALRAYDADKGIGVVLAVFFQPALPDYCHLGGLALGSRIEQVGPLQLRVQPPRFRNRLVVVPLADRRRRDFKPKGKVDAGLDPKPGLDLGFR